MHTTYTLISLLNCCNVANRIQIEILIRNIKYAELEKRVDYNVLYAKMRKKY